MSIDQALLKKLAHMAKLELVEKDAHKLIQQFNTTIEWMHLLHSFKPTSTAATNVRNTVAPQQEDTPQPAMDHQMALQNAPCKDTNYFRVPKVK